MFESGLSRDADAEDDDDDDGRLRLNEYEDELMIVGVRRSDASTYSCRAYNSVGADTRTYTLVVQGSHTPTHPAPCTIHPAPTVIHTLFRCR